MEAYSLVVRGPSNPHVFLAHLLGMLSLGNYGHGDWWFPRAADNATFLNSTPRIQLPNTLHFGEDRIQTFLKNQQLDAPQNEDLKNK
jgi:hypothetical protein